MPANKPFSVDHFRRFCGLMVFEDERQHEPEDWQLAFAEDVFLGNVREAWLIVPEGNGKSTFIAQIGLYGLHYTPEPWIPIGAASRDQAEIIHGQAAGFIRRTEALRSHFRIFDGYRKITSKKNPGRGMKVYPHDPNTGDGVIPAPYALIDELHRHPDLRLYNLWRGKLRKRNAKIQVISTAGEPGTPFEDARDTIRRKAGDRHREDAFLRASGDGLVMHEYMVQADGDCEDMEAVKAANPFSGITAEKLAEDFASSTLDLQEWKRFKCNRPTRSVQVAITDKEWDDAEVDAEPPAGAKVNLGLDVAWKWDTTAFVALWKGPEYMLLCEPRILTPPRDGTMMHPDRLKEAFLELHERFTIETVVMDTHDAMDIASWFEDEFGLEVIEHEKKGNQLAVADYDAFMDGLRNDTLKHTGDAELRRHVLNAVARRLPGGDYRFDRPSTTRQTKREQDRRVIDGLTAAAYVVQHSTTEKPQKSVYEDRFLVPA